MSDETINGLLKQVAELIHPKISAEIDELHALNFTTGGDWLAEMKRLKKLGKVFIGSVPHDEGQSLGDYFLKALRPHDRTGDFMYWMPEIEAAECDHAMET